MTFATESSSAVLIWDASTKTELINLRRIGSSTRQVWLRLDVLHRAKRCRLLLAYTSTESSRSWLLRLPLRLIDLLRVPLLVVVIAATPATIIVPSVSLATAGVVVSSAGGTTASLTLAIHSRSEATRSILLLVLLRSELSASAELTSAASLSLLASGSLGDAASEQTHFRNFNYISESFNLILLNPVELS